MSGHISGCFVNSFCFLWSFIWSLLSSVLADHDNLKSVLECSKLIMSKWKHDHPLDTEDETLVGLTSEDEADGMDWYEGAAR